MFQLFKKRNFSELVGDTFTFFKESGKHYFRNYFIINGGILLLLMVLVFFLTRIFFESVFSSGMGTTATDTSDFDTVMSNNLPLIIGIGILAGIAVLFLTILSYAYPVAYLDLLREKNNFTTQEILSKIKSRIGKVILFFIASFFILIPIFVLVGLVSIALFFIIIGIPLLLIILPAMMSWFSLSFYHYISTEEGYFASLGKGFTLIKQKFWPVVGSTAIMYLIMQILIGFVSMIPYMIGIFSFVSTMDGAAETPNQNNLSFFMIMMLLTMLLSLLLNFILQNLILINQGIIYYSLREENENNTPKSEIDLIGTHIE